MRTMGRRPTGYLLQERDSRMKTLFWQFCSILPQPSRPSSFKRKKKDEAKNLRFSNRTVMQHLRNVCEPVSQSRHSSYYCRTLHDPRRLGAEWNRWLAAGPLCGDRSHGIDSDATSKKYSERKYRQLRLSHTSLFFHIPHLWYFFHTHYCLCLSCSMYVWIVVTCNLMGNGTCVCVVVSVFILILFLIFFPTPSLTTFLHGSHMYACAARPTRVTCP